jgi:hypothetical protein
MKPDWLMIQFSALVPNGTQGSGIHFQHPDQPLSATTLPQTHPLKTRIAALLQALHFMRDWHPLKSRIATLLQALHFMRYLQVNPFYHGFRHLSRSLSSSLGIWTSVRPRKVGHTTRAANGPFFQAPIVNGWVFSFPR